MFDDSMVSTSRQRSRLITLGNALSYIPMKAKSRAQSIVYYCSLTTPMAFPLCYLPSIIGEKGAETPAVETQPRVNLPVLIIHRLASKARGYLAARTCVSSTAVATCSSPDWYMYSFLVGSRRCKGVKLNDE